MLDDLAVEVMEILLGGKICRMEWLAITASFIGASIFVGTKHGSKSFLNVSIFHPEASSAKSPRVVLSPWQCRANMVMIVFAKIVCMGRDPSPEALGKTAQELRNLGASMPGCVGASRMNVCAKMWQLARQDGVVGEEMMAFVTASARKLIQEGRLVLADQSSADLGAASVLELPGSVGQYDIVTAVALAWSKDPGKRRGKQAEPCAVEDELEEPVEEEIELGLEGEEEAASPSEAGGSSLASMERQDILCDYYARKHHLVPRESDDLIKKLNAAPGDQTVSLRDVQSWFDRARQATRRENWMNNNKNMEEPGKGLPFNEYGK